MLKNKVDELKKEKIVVCPICGEEMKEYNYAYDHKQFGKIYFKCEVCGHKQLV